jgi:hypothetical protein
VIVYCDAHARAHGVVRRNPVGGFIEYSFRDSRFRERNAQAWGFDGHDTSWERLEGRTRWLVVHSRGCRDCGVRDLPIAALVEAFKEGKSKLTL